MVRTAKCGGSGVGAIAELISRLSDPVGDSGRDSGLAVDDAGDGLEAHPGQGGHVAERRASSTDRSPGRGTVGGGHRGTG